MMSAMIHLHLRPQVIAIILIGAALGTPGRAAAVANPAWSTTAEVFSGRAYLAAVTGPDGKIYTFGGANTRTFPNQLRTAEAYDPRTGLRETLPQMPRARDAVAAAVGADGRLYVFGGAGPPVVLPGDVGAKRHVIAEVDAYDPAGGEWSTPTSLPTPREGLAAVAGRDGRIYTIGGATEDGEYSDVVEAFDPWCNEHSGADGKCTITNPPRQQVTVSTWEQLPPLSMPRALLGAVAATDGGIYALGGIGPSGTLATVETTLDAPLQRGLQVDLEWRPVAEMKTPRSAFGATVGPDRIYALGGAGATNSAAMSSAEVYDVQTGNWSSLADLPAPRSGVAAATDASDRVYAIGGIGVASFRLEYPGTFDVLSPTGATWTAGSGTWSKGAAMPTGREGLATTASVDGRAIYALGGFHEIDGAPLATAEQYAPSTPNSGAWTPLPPMPTARAYLGAATGDDGRVYAIGGVRGEWSATPDPPDPPILRVICKGGDTCDGANSSSLPDGEYGVTYDWRNSRGVTRGAPVARTRVTAGQTIEVTLPDFPGDVSSADVYLVYEYPDQSGLCGPWRLAAATTADTTVLLDRVPGGFAGLVFAEQGWPAQNCGLPDSNLLDQPWPLSNTTGPYVNVVEAYRPGTREWTEVALLPGDAFVTGDLWGLAAVNVPRDNIYVFGGIRAGRYPSPDVLAYDVQAGAWHYVASMPGGGRVLLAAAVGADGRIYVMGGNTGGNQPSVDTLDRVEIFDPRTHGWTRAAPMLSPRQGLAAVATPDGKIYALGGSNGSNTHLFTAEVYDIGSNKWTAIANLPGGVRDLAAASALGHIFAFGGHGDQPPSTAVQVYSP
jgi:N-acetylneuraminic acid mutarotase